MQIIRSSTRALSLLVTSILVVTFAATPLLAAKHGPVVAVTKQHEEGETKHG